MKKFLNEFKEFALRGNVLDLAVGVIIGAAFQSVVSSLTDNIISPILGLFHGANFDGLHISLFEGQLTIRYGAFITSVINFIIMALVIFLIVKGMNKLAGLGKQVIVHPTEPAAPKDPDTMKCPYCLTAIPFGATRCPNCTAEFMPKQVEAAEADARKAAEEAAKT